MKSIFTNEYDQKIELSADQAHPFNNAPNPDFTAPFNSMVLVEGAYIRISPRGVNEGEEEVNMALTVKEISELHAFLGGLLGKIKSKKEK